ncbi:MAG: secondary thiamine-phosphate synthase enzyme YjbQ [Desulfovibrio sp.]|jgi:secondary thiamine-phosphate synthase enzyme|nr:secondary thiamine-phosphate synthase enzyme YjbQ [Desulfovibrio sp.]
MAKMVLDFSIYTDREGCYDITSAVREEIRKSAVSSGLCVVYCPHTTAGITINENADQDVVRDLLFGLDKAFPYRLEFRHSEGNSPAHLKAGCIGSSVTVIIENCAPLLGTWQGVYFCEFDGPRHRTYHVKIVGD